VEGGKWKGLNGRVGHNNDQQVALFIGGQSITAAKSMIALSFQLKIEAYLLTSLSSFP
jgi:hypothetical protein